MTRHPFRAYPGQVTCLACGDHRDIEAHYGRAWHLVGEVFELGWGLAWLAVLAAPVIAWLVRA